MKAKKGDKDFNATPLNLKRGLVTAILVVSVLAMFTAGASAADIYVNPGDSIQVAVDGATAGDTIHVAAGDYIENVDVNKAHLTLQGEGADVVTVTAQSEGDHVFSVTEDYVNISGLTVTGTTSYPYAGIYLNSADHCNISNNNASNNDYGIRLDSSSDNTLTSNTANWNTGYGIWLFPSSDNNTLTSNTASNSNTGIYLITSSNNTLTSNTANSNTQYGIYLYSSSDNNITCNWVAHNEQQGFYLTEGSTGNNISYNNIMSNGEAASGSWHYNFYNGQDDAVTATNNYWGTTSSAVIAESIYDKNDEGSKGTVTYDPFLNNPDHCAPIPEVATIILFSVGLVVLAGYVCLRRRE